MKTKPYLIIALFTGLLFGSCDPLKRKFQSEGKSAKGVIIDKIKDKKIVDGEIEASYTLEIWYSTDSKVEKRLLEESSQKRDGLDQFLNDLPAYFNLVTGKTIKARASVSPELFEKYAQFQPINIIYLPEDPELIMLQEQLIED